jgi:putative DNA primase/helicase
VPHHSQAKTSTAEAGVLLPHHATLIEASAIAPDVARETGYYSETRGARLSELGFPAKLAPALVSPIHDTTGRVVMHQIRPDNPRTDRKGKVRKYETPYRAGNRLAVHPRSVAALGNPKVPLVITEGVRKRDAAVSVGLCAVGLLGVWNWRGTNDHGGTVALPDWNDVALKGRRVYLAFDSDAWENPGVYDALSELRAWLS